MVNREFALRKKSVLDSCLDSCLDSYLDSVRVLQSNAFNVRFVPEGAENAGVVVSNSFVDIALAFPAEHL